MSYILDALRRADAERDRGEVPHLHTQAVPAGEMDAEGASPKRPWLWLAAGLAIGLLVALGWVIGGRSPAEESPSAAVPQAAVTPAPAPDAPPSAPAKVDDDTPAAAQAAPPSIVPRSLTAAPSPVVPRATPSPSPSTAAAEPRARVTAAANTPREAAITQLAELPQDIRRELPQLTIGGSMYSEKPASRMLIVNGQLLREGDKISPTVTLEQIRLRSAVLTYKTYRYEIGF